MRKSVAAPGGLVRVETCSDHLSDPHEVHDVAHDRIVLPGDAQRFVNLPGSPDAMRAAERVAALPADLQSLGLAVSTGPVVDFRNRQFLTAARAEGSVPLIYPANVGSLFFPRTVPASHGAGSSVAVSTLEGATVSSVIRDLLAEHVERRRRDPEFQAMLQRNLQRHEELLSMLADG